MSGPNLEVKTQMIIPEQSAWNGPSRLSALPAGRATHQHQAQLMQEMLPHAGPTGSAGWEAMSAAVPRLPVPHHLLEPGQERTDTTSDPGPFRTPLAKRLQLPHLTCVKYKFISVRVKN